MFSAPERFSEIMTEYVPYSERPVLVLSVTLLTIITVKTSLAVVHSAAPQSSSLKITLE